MASKKGRLLIHSLQELVLICNDGRKSWPGHVTAVERLSRKDGDSGFCVSVDSNGNIDKIGSNAEVFESVDQLNDLFETVIDGRNKTLIPGLIDGHTHPVWAGDRVHEFQMKLAGATYMQIHKAGGGIHFTVEATRRASFEQLGRSFDERLLQMSRNGTTLVECKSGYGLNWESELKMLQVIDTRRRSDQFQPIEVSSTYCGAHAVPKGWTAEEACADIIDNQLPALNVLRKAGQLNVDNIDVFCESGVFDVDQSSRILLAGKKSGLAVNFHADELTALDGALMGAKIGADAISHLEFASEAAIKAMANAGTVAVLLPTTAYMLKLKHPPVSQMLDNNVAVALGTDFNPNAHCLSMPIVMHLACCLFGMTMDEALVGATLNAAASLRRSDVCGSIEHGKQADFVLLDAPRWEHIIYQFGGATNAIDKVFKRGKVVFEKAA